MDQHQKYCMLRNFSECSHGWLRRWNFIINNPRPQWSSNKHAIRSSSSIIFLFNNDTHVLKSVSLFWPSGIQFKRELRVHCVHFCQLGVLNISSSLVHIFPNQRKHHIDTSVTFQLHHTMNAISGEWSNQLRWLTLFWKARTQLSYRKLFLNVTKQNIAHRQHTSFQIHKRPEPVTLPPDLVHMLLESTSPTK